MPNKQLFAPGVLIASALLLSGASAPWLKKDFKDWTKADAQALLSESPWAKKVTLPLSTRGDSMVMESGTSSDSTPSASLGSSPNVTGNTGMVNGPAASPGSSTGAGTAATSGSLPRASTAPSSPIGMARSAGAPELQPSMTIIWASALPVRLAESRMRSGDEQPTGEQLEAALKPRDNYVIAVTGLPEPDDQAKIPQLAHTAFLSVQGKGDIQATRSSFRKFGETNVYFFRFPRTTVIAATDKTVEFRVTVGTVQLKKRFEVKDMSFQGKLDL